MARKKSAKALSTWIENYLRDQSPRSKSLIISAFGDSIAPYSDGIWLGELINMMAPLGLSERLVRTSAFRLIDEGWLSARRDGRRSYYTLTGVGQRKFEQAYSHIYDPPETHWDGHWTLVILPRHVEASAERTDFKKELTWSGFATLSHGLFAHPSIPPTEVHALIARCKLVNQVIVMRAEAEDDKLNGANNSSFLQGWDIADLSERYDRFLELMSPLPDIIASNPMSPHEGFLIQTLLIHSFRRTNLNDPRIPLTLLPGNWPGMKAFELCKKIYCHTFMLTADYLAGLPGFESMDRAGSRLKMPVGLRFGGLLHKSLAA